MMFSNVNWNQPTTWHQKFSSDELSIFERGILISFFAGLTALCAQLAFTTPWTPVPYTFQTFAVMATGVYLKRNDAFLSGSLYLLVGALGAPIFAGGGSGLTTGGVLIASGGYLLAFPVASAIVAEGLDRSRKAGVADVKAQMICWLTAMIPVYVFGTLWLQKFLNDAYGMGLTLDGAAKLGTYPFLVWDFLKILGLLFITTKVWKYSSEEEIPQA